MASQVNRALIFINQLAGETEQPVLSAPGMHVTEKSLEFLEKQNIFGRSSRVSRQSSRISTREQLTRLGGHEVQPPTELRLRSSAARTVPSHDNPRVARNSGSLTPSPERWACCADVRTRLRQLFSCELRAPTFLFISFASSSSSQSKRKNLHVSNGIV